ncbi:hypothetical protein GCM10012290_18310 [Halolactibacillus alkaliphilus]|nr:hypothetical protein GCM10012290_18310 [Halolactibacillus alkaliphilus]
MDMGNSPDPPRFNCEKCVGEILPLYYTSLHGITYKNQELKSSHRYDNGYNKSVHEIILTTDVLSSV